MSSFCLLFGLFCHYQKKIKIKIKKIQQGFNIRKPYFFIFKLIIVVNVKLLSVAPYFMFHHLKKKGEKKGQNKEKTLQSFFSDIPIYLYYFHAEIRLKQGGKVALSVCFIFLSSYSLCRPPIKDEPTVVCAQGYISAL